MSTRAPLDESYFLWLYSQIANARARRSSKSYWDLAKQLHQKEFVWIIPNDENRVEDGRQLRYEFIEMEEVDVDQDWMDLGCSMLEMLIALSRRLSFETDREPRDWFWHLLDNIGLSNFNDRSDYRESEIDSILEQVIFRKYDRLGRGGLFPVRGKEFDQRRTEIWYQMSMYLSEHR